MEVRLINDGESLTQPADAVPGVVSQGGVVWIDFDHTDEDGMALLASLIKVYPADVQDCYTRTPVPKIHTYPTICSARSTEWPVARTGAYISSRSRCS